ALIHADCRSTDQLIVKCTNCTGLLTEGSVFLLEDGTSAALSLRQSVFGRPGADFLDTDERPLVLLRQADEPGNVSFKGEGNAYYRFDASWLRQGERTTSLLESDSSTVLKKNPWKNASPLKILESPAKFRDAFQIDDQ